ARGRPPRRSAVAASLRCGGAPAPRRTRRPRRRGRNANAGRETGVADRASEPRRNGDAAVGAGGRVEPEHWLQEEAGGAQLLVEPGDETECAERAEPEGGEIQPRPHHERGVGASQVAVDQRRERPGEEERRRIVAGERSVEVRRSASVELVD